MGIAHGEAEESEVYPKLVRKDAIEGADVEHAEHEHAEGNEKPLALLECKPPIRRSSTRPWRNCRRP